MLYYNLLYALYGIIIFILRNPILKLVKKPKENDRKIINSLSAGYILIGLITSIIYIDGMYVLIVVLGFPWLLIEYYKS
ncbi:hypothetical protein CHF27_010985 [Romboutsia maritimum]|uniref:Uncharacterized protein n=1 Tax=Romboutsia maritimum TaxID=2020948 RepID=A0A371IR41_9FIRM|nr:hypothetical protein [Romboutsia maritimum]RDY22934.1 hypothetical protein CHF27_010985 [Romboutsia maritimum]